MPNSPDASGDDPAADRLAARIVLLTGPSGAGKSRLADRLAQRCGWPVVRLDDFYREGGDPGLPRSAELGIVDWDDPASWDSARALTALQSLIDSGRAEAPIYDISTSSITGHREVTAPPEGLILAEGIFAAELVGDLAERGTLHSAWCIRHHRAHTFLLRLVRDLRERRKPPLTLLRRGWVLMRREPAIVARHRALGARCASPAEAERALTTDVG